jgi:hypothetical protein
MKRFAGASVGGYVCMHLAVGASIADILEDMLADLEYRSFGTYSSPTQNFLSFLPVHDFIPCTLGQSGHSFGSVSQPTQSVMPLKSVGQATQVSRSGHSSQSVRPLDQVRQASALSEAARLLGEPGHSVRQANQRRGAQSTLSRRWIRCCQRKYSTDKF